MKRSKTHQNRKRQWHGKSRDGEHLNHDYQSLANLIQVYGHTEVCEAWLNDRDSYITWHKDNAVKGYRIARYNTLLQFSEENCYFASPADTITQRRTRNDNQIGITGLSYTRNGKIALSIQYQGQRYRGIYETVRDAFDAKRQTILDNELPHRLGILPLSIGGDVF